jgi:hypothetical protein
MTNKYLTINHYELVIKYNGGKIKIMKSYKITYIAGNGQKRTRVECANSKLGAKQKLGRVLANVREYKKVEQLKSKRCK